MMHFIVTLLCGAVAGWLAGQIMNTKHSILINIILGLLGGVVGGIVFGFFGIGAAGPLKWIGSILISMVGACILIWLYRLLIGKK
ncbi:MAG: GlsB/YeaQ/YmgE family stress response membrane protein [Lachnospiraceae bacterium]|nr:GlsB/YeaQ/YmgE family stress response membrane protein [Lachnospiraceae bacterium]